MAEALGATAGATALIGQSLNLIRRVTSTIKHFKNHDSRLECIYNDLSGIIEIIELVGKVEPLGTARVSNAVKNMLEHAKKLDLHIQDLKEKHSKSTARQVMNQLMDGSQDLEDTKRMIDELTTLKATLILEIQVVHMCLFVKRGQAQQNDSGCPYTVNSDFLRHFSQAVEQKLGKEKGHRIAEVLQRKQPDDDGMIHLTTEDYNCLVSDPLGEDEANSQRDPIRVAENTSTDDATQVNGSVGDAEITHIQTIERNEASGQSFQVNGAMNGDAFGKLLESRSKPIEDQRQQSPSMHRQLVNGSRRTRSCSPRPSYRRPATIRYPNHRINGTRGALTGLRQVTMAKERVSVDVFQVREDDGGARNGTLVFPEDDPCNSNEKVL